MILFERPDSSAAVAHALEMSKKFGPTSKEAASAWDIVEELDSSDNSAAFKESAESRVKYDKEFDDKFKLLANILAENQDKVKKIKTLAQEIQAIKFVKPQGGKPGADSPELKKALTEAKEATENHGPGSKEAIQAWMTVEEIASSDQSEASAGNLDEECFIQTIEACEALEEINRIVDLQKFEGSRYGG
mmetsp:Transcript_5838/g.8588  ORF Transcript_5838/g.8588 Transcript_5838/m.8588 type:complete len:190 (-) Transcript_5838:115-684(-)